MLKCLHYVQLEYFWLGDKLRFASMLDYPDTSVFGGRQNLGLEKEHIIRVKPPRFINTVLPHFTQP